MVDSVRFLGVIIDNKSKFKEHTDNVCKKVSRSTGIIRRVGSFVPDFVLMRFYFSHVQSHLTYGILAWGNSSVGNTSGYSDVSRNFSEFFLVPLVMILPH